MARRLAATYAALRELSSYDASGEVKNAAGDLAGAIDSIAPLPNVGVDPATIFGNIAGQIVGWKQSRDIKAGAQLGLQALEKIRELFAAELEAYRSISEERANKITAVAEDMIRKKMILAHPLLSIVPEALGLEWERGQTRAQDDTTVEALIAVAKIRLERVFALSVSASDSIGDSLGALVGNHRRFNEKKGLSLAQVLAAVEKAQSRLDEIAESRSRDE